MRFESIESIAPDQQRIFYDNRWSGSGGIGRFGVNLRRQLEDHFGYKLLDVELGGRPTDFADPVRLGRYLRRERASLYISPGYNVPFCSPCETISTVHDLIHLQDPQQKSLAKVIYYRYLLAPAIRNAPLTLTVSNHSRQAITDHFGVNADRVVVVGNGIDDRFVPASPASVGPGRKPYFLYVGNTKPHKNLPVLIRAFADPRLSNHQLVLACPPTLSLQRLIRNLGIEQRVVWRPELTDAKLIDLYQHAAATVLPSWMEGFGLPIIEAMACGCPIIGSDRGSIPEIMSNAGIQFDADVPDSLADAMHVVASQPQQRQRLTDAGLTRVRQFTWEAVATRVDRAIKARQNHTSSSSAIGRSAKHPLFALLGCSRANAPSGFPRVLER